MARPKRKGLDYFPKDTDIYSDRKIRKLLNEFGTKGIVIHDYLLCLIYAEAGYWVQYTDDLKFDTADVLKNGITDRLVDEVVNGCVRFGLFNENLFNTSGVLTSNGIQKRYLMAKKGGVIDEKHRVLDDETTENNHLIPKVKESKGEESKEKDIANKKKLFKETLEPYLSKYGREMLNAFYQYWTEANKSMTCLKWELEDTWELNLRLIRWDKNNLKQQKGGGQSALPTETTEERIKRLNGVKNQ